MNPHFNGVGANPTASSSAKPRCNATGVLFTTHFVVAAGDNHDTITVSAKRLVG